MSPYGSQARQYPDPQSFLSGVEMYVDNAITNVDGDEQYQRKAAIHAQLAIAQAIAALATAVLATGKPRV